MATLATGAARAGHRGDNSTPGQAGRPERGIGEGNNSTLWLRPHPQVGIWHSYNLDAQGGRSQAHPGVARYEDDALSDVAELLACVEDLLVRVKHSLAWIFVVHRYLDSHTVPQDDRSACSVRQAGPEVAEEASGSVADVLAPAVLPLVEFLDDSQWEHQSYLILIDDRAPVDLRWCLVMK